MDMTVIRRELPLALTYAGLALAALSLARYMAGAGLYWTA